MDLENQQIRDPFETHLIEDIDTNGYLFDHQNPQYECEERNYEHVDLGCDEDGIYKDNICEETNDHNVNIGCDDDEVNDDGIWEKPNEDPVNLICDENDKNIIGKIFDTPDDVYTFYNQYAFLHGFGICIHWKYKNKTTNEVYRKLYVCNKEGFKKQKGDGSSEVSKKRRRDVRTGCEAELQISKKKDGKWCVDIFNNTHNHDLTTTPTKVMKHRSHNKFHRSMACKSLMVELGKSGLRPCQVRKAVNAMKSPHEPTVTSKQCADILAEERKQYKGKEFYSLIKHFQEKAAIDANQYFKINLFDDGSPRNIFWADGRSRDAYLKSGDVVVFDVTYLTNKFKFPFAPFVGVNHHGQSIIFGGALLENEKEETFKWLFEQFLKCMFNKCPSAIITDQDKAICNAIKHVFPNTRHRYCAWHIKKHVLEHLQPFRVRYSDFQESFKKWVRSDIVEEFESQWEVLRDKYNLETSSWMMEMYNQRKFWVAAYFKDIFLAGMTTSGRSESIHSFFDGFVNSKTMLNEFVIQFDKAVDIRRAAEEDEDFKTMNSRPILSSVHPIEAKAGECYNKKIFEVFEKEWIEASNNLTHKTKRKSEENTTYWVGQVNVDKKYWRVVNFRFLDNLDVTCSCAMFKTYGILCKHILYVMKKKHVDTLPDHYILPRWTLDFRYKVGNASIGIEETNSENGVSAFALWYIQSNCTKAIEQARDAPLEIKRLNSFLVEFLEDQMIRRKPTEIDNAYKGARVGISQVDIMPQISVRDPIVLTNTKGRPRNATRAKPPLEVKQKRTVTCSFCGEPGHNISGCKKKKALSMQEKE